MTTSPIRLCAALALLVCIGACVPGDGPGTSHTVTLIADGTTRVLTTEALTVRDLLTEAGIALDEDDRVSPVEPTLLEDGMTVRVTRVEVRTQTEQREIPFSRQTMRDASIPAGETRLLEPGLSGLEELVYLITLEDGVEVERRLVRQVTLREPRAEVVLVGVQAEQKPVPITGTIAYVGNRNAWVIQTVSPNRRRLTHSGDLDLRVFTLSPDGSHLLFTRVPTETGPGLPLNTLWLIATTTADAQPVPLKLTNILWADWDPRCRPTSPNESCRIAYSTGVTVEGSPGWRAENDLWTARVRLRDGRLSDQRRFVEPSAGGSYGWWGTTYAWSPDGRSLAYARADAVGLVRLSDGRQTTLASFTPFRTYAPWVWVPSLSWSPEGNFIVTTLHGPSPAGGAPEDSPVFDVWALAANGAFTAELVSEAGMWAAPTFAPEGELIAFGYARSPYASQTSGYDIYLMDRDGSDRRPLFPPEGELGLNYPAFTWGPGGDRLLLVYQGNLYLVTTDGTAQRLTDEGNVAAVRWRW
ncbi:MAG: G5 domain-containing protein [Anaerolineae bacterium]|nr:G5 domain-containing protein [Anaerolineae bacterium]